MPSQISVRLQVRRLTAPPWCCFVVLSLTGCFGLAGCGGSDPQNLATKDNAPARDGSPPGEVPRQPLETGPTVELKNADGTSVAASQARASAIENVAGLPPLGHEVRPLSAIRFEPDGAQFPNGLLVKWPLAEAREAGEQLAIVYLDEKQGVWNDSGTMAVVDASGKAAEGLVFHFSTAGVSPVDDLLKEGVPLEPRRTKPSLTGGTGSTTVTLVDAMEAASGSTAETPPRVDNAYGVAFVPFTGGGEPADSSKKLKGKASSIGEWDKVEKYLFEIVGTMPEVDHVFAMESGPDLWKKLAAIKARGKKIDLLVIAAHGGSAEQPQIQMGFEINDAVIPEDVDYAWIRSSLRTWKSLLKNRQFKALSEQELRQNIATYDPLIPLMEAVAGVMNKNGKVLMINCSAAASERGRKFVKNLGRILLLPEGGQIWAPRNDVQLRVIASYFASWLHQQFYGEWLEEGDLVVDGDWVRFRVRPKQPGLYRYDGLASSNRLWQPGEVFTTKIETNTNLASSAALTIDTANGNVTGEIVYGNRYQAKITDAQPNVSRWTYQLSGKPVATSSDFEQDTNGKVVARGSYQLTLENAGKTKESKGAFVAVLFRGESVSVPAYPNYRDHFLAIYNVDRWDGSLANVLLQEKTPSPLDPPGFKPLHPLLLGLLRPASD